MFVLLTLLTLSWGWCVSPHPRPKCDRCNENFVCDCTSLNLQEVPAISTTSVISLDLSFNEIKTIGQDDFFEYSNLHVLILRGNMISSIAEQGFSTLRKLEVLDLSDNQLNGLSEMWFKSLSSLHNLNLLGNEYKTFGGKSLFRSMTQLSTLMVGNQFLASVSKDSFIGPNHLQSFVFHGSNLQNYQPGSFSQINSIDEVTVSINGPFQINTSLTTDILRDLSRPETKIILSDLRISWQQLKPFQVIFQKGVKNFLLRNLSCNMDTIGELFAMTHMSELTSIGLEDSEFNGEPTLSMEFPELPHIRETYIKNVKIEKFYIFPALICGNFLCLPVLRFASQLKRLIIIDSNYFAMPCSQSLLFISLEYLDISRNQFSDLTVAEAFCHGQWTLLNLVTFNVSSNYLKSFDTLSHLFRGMKKLAALDVSLNVFRTMPQVCDWPQSLRYLNLSSCQLRGVTSCLPQTLHILDLSYNDLMVFHQNMPNLTELHLSGNRFKTLPEGKLFDRLVVLYIKSNPFISFSQNQMRNFGGLRILEAGTDTYVCSCEFVNFFNHELGHLVSLKDSRQAYICSSPFALRGTKVSDAQLSVFECHAALAFSALCVFVLVVVIGAMVMCHKLHMIWYVRMTWAWLQAKRRPVARKDQVCYDAFVSYSESDAEWVEELLVPELEGAQPPFRLCLHKRDFLPGGWIADSIMAAMEKSHRILFIVTQHFVQSDWCRLELEYSHFRLFDAGILILLEPIPDSTIPKRFCKLRKVMNSRTYLEWPEEDNERSRFWQSLKDTLHMAE
ncbi:toll-like receptor 2 type-2 isoform X1 [Alosa pseudoharengus]|uniref:toll-like receptor 2 type-2 isoform X1 n=2 Tax=Alosa pseudoharengus TaxID=34774 RepID=UPI003F8B6716